MAQLRVLDQQATYKQDVVDLLKEWLGRAEAGEVVSVSIIADLNGDAFEIASSKIEDLVHRLGKIRLLEHQIIDQAKEFRELYEEGYVDGTRARCEK